MWLPVLFTGQQWAAVVNCGLSIAICIRNFTAVDRTTPQAERELQSA
jgi:hypothetical protein